MINLEDVLPPDELKSFNYNVFRGSFEQVKEVIETQNIDVNSVFDKEGNETILANCLSGFEHGEDNMQLTKYLLDNGANPNIQDKYGNSAFHYAIYSKNLELIELMMNYNIEVNQKAEGGYTTFFAFLKYTYAELAFKGIPLKKRCLVILEKMLALGADIDIKSSYGSNARTFYSPELASVLALYEKFEELSIPKQKASNLRPPSNLKYPKVCKEIWKKYVPSNGKSDTVVGELLRAIEKLRDEAQRNGNGNYHNMHKSLALYIRDTLISYKMFDEKEIKKDIKPLTYKTQPYLDDDIYDRFCDRIAEVYIKFPDPIYRNKN
ncbi:ankyrin repeat domain-containing protein [Flavivirga jejuensis]|uniref:Ankyrin repeat domain-containing protein n=1 Tax=Flavivirga jejuensis TaxID=870487 RepID=A0ABT8WI68_9FLAO|nr:ankyrin repeat domain-containing protein [Flavivirga jejuensis]MDO5972671.1 ankyrin repeat domain-containing protein [Flavivirga jejuensis]